ncbi:hypothetical protein [Rhodococcus opacus]|uniref:hypothetical protein n=1 Tax=Rhodococcus opacus TaxID=37919 RepID=UPI001009B7A3|nr:hypothetical protein [Rhodococcus opacus]
MTSRWRRSAAVHIRFDSAGRWHSPHESSPSIPWQPRSNVEREASSTLMVIAAGDERNVRDSRILAEVVFGAATGTPQPRYLVNGSSASA